MYACVHLAHTHAYVCMRERASHTRLSACVCVCAPRTYAYVCLCACVRLAHTPVCACVRVCASHTRLCVRIHVSLGVCSNRCFIQAQRGSLRCHQAPRTMLYWGIT